MTDGPSAPPVDDRPLELERRIPKLLRAGLLASSALMAVGLAWLALRGAPSNGGFNLFGLGGLLSQGDPRGVIGLGMLLLLVTPLGRVAASLAYFAKQRDGLYVALTLFVLCTLISAVALGAV